MGDTESTWTPDPHRMRRAAAGSALRAVLTSTALVLVYFVVPLDGRLSASGTLLLLVGLVAFGVMLAWQVGSITRSPFPMLRGLEVLATAVPFLFLLFATVYFLMARGDPPSFSEPLTRLDAVYFTVTAFATVGFGDIVPRSEVARATVTAQMVIDLLVVGIGVRLLLGAVRVGRSRRERETGIAGSTGPSSATVTPAPSQRSVTSPLPDDDTW